MPNYYDYDHVTFTKESLAPSPFHLNENWIVRIENHNKNCTHAEIDSLILSTAINDTDLHIIKLLAAYPYINTYNITFFLNHSLPEPYKKKDYQRNLRKLVHAGILLKHALYQNHPGAAPDGYTPSPVSPLRFYSLSPGAYSYISPIVDTPHCRTEAIPDYRIMENLAISQLLLHFHVTNGEHFKKHLMDIKKMIGKHTLTIDSYIHYSSSVVKPGASVHIFIFCCRSHKDSHSDLIHRLVLLFHWMNRHKEQYPEYMVLILMETLKDIPLIAHDIFTQTKRETAYPLYYTLDTNLLSYPLLDSLYQYVEDPEAGKCDIQRISVHL